MHPDSDLPPIRLRDLRHVAASLAIQAGADLKVIQDQLGHSSIVITADTYVSILPDHARKAAEDTAMLIAYAGRRAPVHDDRISLRSPGSSLRKPADPVWLAEHSYSNPAVFLGRAVAEPGVRVVPSASIACHGSVGESLRRDCLEPGRIG